MAHPKRKTSKTRRDKRRTHYKSSAPTVATCQNCGTPHLYHRACPACGYYKGQQVIAVKEAASV